MTPFNGKITRRQFLQTASLGSIAFAGGCLNRRISFLSPDSSQATIRFVFFTDVHARTEWDTPQALQKAAEEINKQNPDFIIAGGDLITDGFQSSAETIQPRLQAYLTMHNSITAPVYPVLGNHDLVGALPEDGSKPSDDPRRIFCETFGLHKTYRSFDAGGYHFILLDTINIIGGKLKYNGMVNTEQLEWLKEDLSILSPSTPVIVISHIPLLTSFYQATRGTILPTPENRVIVNNVEVLNILDKSNLILVLQGHLHIVEMIKLFGTTFITGGAICAKWWRGHWFGTEEGFGVVTLHGNKIAWEYIDYNWTARRPDGL